MSTKVVPMLIAAAFVCLLAIVAADPPRPVITETFDSFGNVEIHREATSFGSFRISWDPSTKHGMQNVTTKNGNLTIDAEELYLQDKGIVYYYRAAGSAFSCATEKASGNLPLYWGWLKYANYTGMETLKHVVYDQWQLQVAGVNFEVLVGQNSPNRPFQYIVTESHSQTKYEFTNFTTTAPPPSVFALPPSC